MLRYFIAMKVYFVSYLIDSNIGWKINVKRLIMVLGHRTCSVYLEIVFIPIFEKISLKDNYTRIFSIDLYILFWNVDVQSKHF